MLIIRLWMMLVVAALVGALVVPSAQASMEVRYVALGDSYSAGLGVAGSYTGGACERSGGAFPALWSAAHPRAQALFVACSGADTASVIRLQVPALTAATTLVSVTVGGNDVGFSTIMSTCALHGTAACKDAVDSAEGITRNALPGRLDATYQAIRARAPAARVVVLSYPLFYQLHVWFCIGLSEAARAKVDEGIDLIDDTIAAAAARAGFTFADVRGAFVGHQLCSGSKWLHAADLADLQKSYHPTGTGQANAYLPAFTAAAS